MRVGCVCRCVRSRQWNQRRRGGSLEGGRWREYACVCVFVCVCVYVCRCTCACVKGNTARMQRPCTKHKVWRVYVPSCMCVCVHARVWNIRHRAGSSHVVEDCWESVRAHGWVGCLYACTCVEEKRGRSQKSYESRKRFCGRLCACV